MKSRKGRRSLAREQSIQTPEHQIQLQEQKRQDANQQEKAYRQQLLDLVSELQLQVHEHDSNEPYDPEIEYDRLAELGITRSTLNQRGELYMTTRRIIDGREWLDPDDPEVVDLFEYVLARACQKFGVESVQMVLMYNHIHLSAWDVGGKYAPFCNYFYWLTALKMNKSLGRKGQFWIDDGRDTAVLADLSSAVIKGVYMALNPVAAGYVMNPEDWPLVNVLPKDLDAPAREIDRPAQFSLSSRLPETESLRYVTPKKPGFDAFPQLLAEGIELMKPAAQKLPRNKRKFQKGFAVGPLPSGGKRAIMVAARSAPAMGRVLTRYVQAHEAMVAAHQTIKDLAQEHVPAGCYRLARRIGTHYEPITVTEPRVLDGP